MRQWILNVLYLGFKEIASVLRDVAMVGLIIYVFLQLPFILWPLVSRPK
ncbi:hypothetical protein ACFSKM_01165 [Ancylobacter dichloromethanicus]